MISPVPASGLKRKASGTSAPSSEKKIRHERYGEGEPGQLASTKPTVKPLTNRAETPGTDRPKLSSAKTLANAKSESGTSVKPPSQAQANLNATVPKNPPKKGSFAEIMARQNAAKVAPAPGLLQNKPIEKISEKKKLMLMKRGLWDREKNAPKKKAEKPGQNLNSSKSQERVQGAMKDKAKENVDTGYKGTPKAAPLTPKPQPTYRGTMKTVPKDLPKREKAKARQSRDRYLDTDEEEDGDEEVEHDEIEEDVSVNGYSDESDDMEAGFGDVENEEEEAARQARKDDAAEAAMEAKLKREKEERKKRLEAMAKRAKPRSY